MSPTRRGVIGAPAAAEERDRLARRQAEAGSPVNESDNDAALVFKNIDNEMVQRAQPEQDWTSWERWMTGHLDNFRDELFDAIAEFGVRLIEQERVAVDRKIAVLEGELHETKGLLADVLKR